MSLFEKAKDKAEQLLGGAKEKTGEATGDEDLKASGKTDRAKGEVKETAHDLKDKAAKALHDAKDKLSGK
jgi:uncharacterized protein YjbJ (UPF0337 family)